MRLPASRGSAGWNRILADRTTKRQASTLDEVAKRCRRAMVVPAAFSLVVNVLRADRLALHDAGVRPRPLDPQPRHPAVPDADRLRGPGLLALLEAARSRVMQRIGAWLEERWRRKASPARSRASCAAVPTAWRRCATSVRAAASSAPRVRSRSTTCPGCRSTCSSSSCCTRVGRGGAGRRGAAARPGPRQRTGDLEAAARGRIPAAMVTQRRAESIVRNAEVIDSMGMLPAVMARWRSGRGRDVGAMNRAMDRGAPLLAITTSSSASRCRSRSWASAPSWCCSRNSRRAA